MSYLKDIGKEITEINKSKGWKQLTLDDWMETYKVPAALMLITTEVAEATEGFRKGDFDNFREELADVMIRTIDLAEAFEIDLEVEIAKKLEKNRLRPFKHGGKKI